MRVAIPVLLYLFGCIGLTVGAFLYAVPAGFLVGGGTGVATAFVWPYIQIIPNRRQQQPDMSESFRAVA